MTNQTKTWDEKMTIGREEVENLAGQSAEKPRQSKNKCSSAWKRFEGGRRSSASHMHSVHFPMDKVGYISESPRRKTSAASLCLALVRSPRAGSTLLPSFQVVNRQDGADDSAVSDTGPEVTATDQVETDPAAESRGRSQAQLQRSVDFPWLRKKANRKRTGEWNGKDLPAMCEKNVPAKTLATQRVSFWMRAMTCWAVPWRIDKGPIVIMFKLDQKWTGDLSHYAAAVSRTLPGQNTTFSFSK